MSSAGLVKALDELVWEISANGTHTRSGTEWQTIDLVWMSSYYTVSSTATQDGVSLVLKTMKAGTGVIGSVDENVYQLNIPSLGISEDVHKAFSSTATSKLVFEGLRLYVWAAGEKWRLDWTGIKWYINGVLEKSYAGSSLYGEPRMLQPASIPLFGVLSYSGGKGAVNPAVALGVPPGYSVIQTLDFAVTSHWTIGWTMKEVGATGYTAPPVNIRFLSIPALACILTANTSAPGGTTVASISGTSYYHQSLLTTFQTYDITQCTSGPITDPSHYGHADVWQTTTFLEYYDSAVAPIPALTQSIVRMNNDYQAMWVRGGYPYAKAASTAECHDYVADTGTSAQSSATWHASRSNYLQIVENPVTTIEEVFNDINYAPAAMGGFTFRGRKTHAVVTTPASCPLFPPEEGGGVGDPIYPWPDYNDAYSNTKNSSFPEVETRSSNGLMLSWLDHADNLARYVNYNVHRHFSFFHFFPYNNIPETVFDPAMQTMWPVLGAPIPTEYWILNGQQWMYHADLPVSPKNRNLIVSEPLLNGGLSDFMTAVVYGAPTSFVGISRFYVDDAAPVPDQTYDSDGVWSVDFGSISYGGSTIQVTGDGVHATFNLDLDLGQWGGSALMQYAHVCGTLVLNWSNANISSIAVSLINQAGDAVAVTTVPGTFYRQIGTDSKYCGSWAQDFNVGYSSFLSDLGMDSLPSGISLATLASPEFCEAYSLLRGYDANTLRFQVTLSSPGAVATINYPVLAVVETSMTVVQENRQQAIGMFPAGPNIRFGQRYWWDTALLSTPVPYGPGATHMTLLDWLCERNVFFQGLPASSGTLARIATLLDTVEGQTYQAADEHTFAFVIPANPALDTGNPLRGVMVNTYREVPPLAILPTLVRDRSTYALDNDTYEQATFTFAQKYQKYAAATPGIHIRDDLGAIWTTGDPVSPLGYTVTKHAHAVDNTEDYYDVLCGGTAYAIARPWHGYSAVIGTAPGEDQFNLHNEFGEYARANIQSGDVWFRYTPHPVPVAWDVETQVTSTGSCSRPRFAFDSRGRIYLVYQRGGSSYTRYSDDDGRTWNAEAALGTNWTRPTIAVSDETDPETVRAGYTTADKYIRGTYQQSGDVNPSAEFIFKDNVGNNIQFADDGFHLSFDRSGAGRWLLTCKLFGDANSSDWFSTDNCRTWTRIT